MKIATPDTVIALGTTCQCWNCESCGVGQVSETGTCPDCESTMTPSMDCFDCQDFDAAQWEFENWVQKTGAVGLGIDGRNMTWRRVSRSINIEADWKSFLDTMTFRADWTLQLEFNTDGSFTATRYSHDEPTGASFTITPLSEGEFSEE